MFKPAVLLNILRQVWGKIYFFKETNIFFQQGHINEKYIYKVTRDFHLN